MAGEFSQYHSFDEEAAARVKEILVDNGIEPLEVCCRVDRFGRMTVEAEISRQRQRRVNRAVFTREVSAACGRVFSPPCVSDAGETCRLQMCQRPAYDVARGFSQYSARNGAFCGDSACVFADGSGRLVAVLSDGMGTGGRAAVDGAMTCAMAESLLKAGIGFDSMLQTAVSYTHLDVYKRQIHDAMIALAGELGVKNGTLLWPVRIAAAGTLVTPGGAMEILTLLGREEALRRLRLGLEKLKG